MNLDENQNHPNRDLAIAGLMQHYGFDTSFLDFTSELSIAAAFAATGSIGDTGQIMVLKTEVVEDKYFDLTQIAGNRPKIQSAFALWGNSNLDLKSDDLKKSYESHWLKFTLTEQDKRTFDDPDILSIKEDEVATHIFDWYETHVLTKEDINQNIAEYFADKIDALKKHL